MSETELLTVGMIRTDGGTQTRARLEDDHVQSLADLLASGAKFDTAPVVFYDGAAYWLADGFHRIAAHRLANIQAVNCSVRQGTLRDAILFSVGANEEHKGLRRTNPDKRRAVEMLLNDEEWMLRSDRWIAEQCRVGDHMVAAARKESRVSRDSARTADTVETSDGRYYTKPGKTSSPGAERKRKTPVPPPVEDELEAVEIDDDEKNDVEVEIDDLDQFEESVPDESEPPRSAPSERAQHVVVNEPVRVEPPPVAPPVAAVTLREAWERAGVNERQELLSRIGSVQTTELLRLVKQRNADADVARCIKRDNNIYPPGKRSREYTFYDFILSGGDVALASLGLDYCSSLDELKLNYRRESMRHHPDKGGSPERMVAINAAHTLVKSFFEELEA